MRKAKIICTLGPSSSSRVVLKKLIDAGMDVARLNFSHGSHTEHLGRIRQVRTLISRFKSPVALLQDLEGYRIRVGAIRDPQGIKLAKNSVWQITNRSKLKARNAFQIDYVGKLGEIKKGFYIFIDDGQIALQVIETSDDLLRARVLVGGNLKSRKGINIPQFRIPFKGMTPKDQKDLHFGISQKIDFVAQSFVRDRDDILIVKEFLKKKSYPAKLIAKIENCEGIMNLDEILKEVDGIMVARGDMGVSVPLYQIPIIQKVIIDKCRLAHKFVITATQMLDSMTDNPRPTRAEVTDVANAILDGSDYAMLSGETAVGQYPVEAVQMMDKIIEFTEHSVRGGKLHFDESACAIPTTLT